MASPLSPAPSTALNLTTPPTSRRCEKYEVTSYTQLSTQLSTQLAATDDSRAAEDADTSSPFVSTVHEAEQENPSPSKSRPTSRVLSGHELSPLKILQDRSNTEENKTTDMPPPPPRSPRKISSPEKRFPVKISPPPEAETPSRSASPQRVIKHDRTMSIEDVMRENEGLQHAIDIFEDEVSVLENGADEAEGDVTGLTAGGADADEADYDETAGVDDTMVSTFSTFSVVPNLTMFNRLGQGQSPAKLSMGGMTPRHSGRGESSPSRTPRANPGPACAPTTAKRDSANTTNLLDFTEQLRFPGAPQSPSRRNRLSPSKTTSNIAATPMRGNLVNLLDFDLPPMPTPRSIPTITPRELESLKSNFLSEISSLKASLSGKEAEVTSLKTAVGDAEKRVGQCLEELREVRGFRDQLTEEREGWERRGREMESVLRKVKDEIVLSHREREELEAKLDEEAKRREAAEMMAQEAESKMAGMRAGKATADAEKAASPEKLRSPTSAASSSSSSSREVEIAVERVARELHAAYKSKHETKVAALKKSYESRWEKKVRELEGRVEDLCEENERLRVGRNDTLTRVEPGAEAEARRAQAVRDSAQITELRAEVEKLEAVVATVQGDNGELRGLLERERVEKGELVQLAEEMMSMQQQQSFIAAATAAAAAVDDDRQHHHGSHHHHASASAASAAAVHRSNSSSGTSSKTATPRRPATTTPRASRTMAAPSLKEPGLRSSAGHSAAGAGPAGGARPSGLKAPGSLPHSATDSRIGRVGASAHERTRSGGAGGLPRPGSGLGMRSGIMSSIEKMGAYRGRAE